MHSFVRTGGIMQKRNQIIAVGLATLCIMGTGVLYAAPPEPPSKSGSRRDIKDDGERHVPMVPCPHCGRKVELPPPPKGGKQGDRPKVPPQGRDESSGKTGHRPPLPPDDRQKGGEKKNVKGGSPMITCLYCGKKFPMPPPPDRKRGKDSGISSVNEKSDMTSDGSDQPLRKKNRRPRKRSSR